MRQEIVTFQRASEVEEKSEGLRPDSIDDILRRVARRSVFINLLGLLLGRASILGGITPFGLAYYASLSGLRLNMPLLFLVVNIGALTAGFSIIQVKYIAALAIFAGLGKLSPIDAKKNLVPAFRVFACVFVVGTAVVFYKGFLLYDFIINTFEAFIGFVMVLLFRNANVFFEKGNDRVAVTSEQIISISILGVLAVTGLSNIAIFGLSIRNMLIISMVLIFALKNGPGVGAAIGLAAGLIVSMTASTTPLIIAAYGFSGLMAGVFKDLGKVGSILGFLLANAIITIYINGSTEVLIQIIDIFAASVIVTLIPNRAIRNINDYFIKPSLSYLQRKSKTEKVKDITIEKLMGFSESFAQLAKTFYKISEKNLNVNKDDVSTLFEEVAERVCRDCSLCTSCWGKEFYNTYQIMFNILEKLEQKSRIARHDVPTHFRDRCLRLDDFIENTNFMYELYNANLMWQKKIIESRSLVSQQLEGVSKIIAELAEEINVDIYFKNDLEKEIQIELLTNGIETEEIMVIENKYGKYEVSVAHKPCQNKRICSTQIVPAVSKVLGRNMVKEDVMCKVKADDTCVIRLLEQQNYRVVTGISTLSKNGGFVSGDNYNILQLKDGKFIIALSDGMGSGEKASKESTAAIALLEKFLQSGFDKDLSIKLINSVLVLKSAEESFATIDLSVVDLFTGEVEFAKIGAASTFIKKPHKIDVIKSTSLPVGILNNVDMEITKQTLGDGDIIVMMTDGVLDSRQEMLKKEEWVVEELAKLETTNPQDIADFLMDRALENMAGGQGDDMTILIAKVLEKVS